MKKRAEEEDEPEEESRAAALLRMLSTQTLYAGVDESAAFGAILLPGQTAPVLGPIRAEQLDAHSKAALGLLAGVRLGQSGNTVVHVGARNGRGKLLAMLLPLLPTEVSDAPNSNGDTRACSHLMSMFRSFS